MEIFIYSRKSKWTGRGESVENQIAMCREYIFAHIPEASKARILEFEDQGYSGKNTNRPQFQRMLEEMKRGECKYLVCYRLDRLGRNIGDLAGFIETLNRRDVSFISIKEQFDTSTPIGKAMLYFAGVLAQMEREQIAERVRDNMLMLARKGRWLGGNTPLGFQARAEETVSVSGKKKRSFCLQEREEELELVKLLFREYLEGESLAGLARYFLNRGLRTKRGREYTPGAIRDILTNPVYCAGDREAWEYFYSLGCQVCLDREEADGRFGLIAYARTSSVQYRNKENGPEKWLIALGKHRGLIKGRDFVRVQEILEENKRGRRESLGRRAQNPSALLSGLLYCSCGRPMRPKAYFVKGGEGGFSYRCPYRDMTKGVQCRGKSAPGRRLDALAAGEALARSKRAVDWEEVLSSLSYEPRLSREEERLHFLRVQTERREREIHNLAAALASSHRDRDFVETVEGEMKRLEEERKELEREKKELEEKRKKGGTFQCRERLISCLSSQEALYEELDIKEKREYLRLVLERASWEEGEVKIRFRL